LFIQTAGGKAVKKSIENFEIYFGNDVTINPQMDFRQEILNAWINIYLPSFGKVLDLGCWDGSFLKMLPPTWEKWGADLARHPDLPSEVTFLPANLDEEFPVGTQTFDLVFAGEIIEHVLATTLFLKNCFKVLKPGGCLILTTPNLSCWVNLWLWFKLGQFYCVNSDTDQDGHVRYLAPRTLRTSLQHVGFDVVEMTSVLGLEFLNRFAYLYQLIFRFFPMRGKNILVLARKPF
jgi:SAM-dependent methyltransferase